jgi:hypothetical protein
MKCLHCKEVIEPGEKSVPVNEGKEAMHPECIFRSVAGSVTHIRRECAAFGGKKDCHAAEQGLSKRQAARAAYREYIQQQAVLN